MALKIEKLKSWTNFLRYLRNEVGEDSDSDFYNKDLKCEINDDAIEEDGQPLECIIVDDCNDVRLFDSKKSCCDYVMYDLDGDVDSISSVWYMDKQVSFKRQVIIEDVAPF